MAYKIKKATFLAFAKANAGFTGDDADEALKFIKGEVEAKRLDFQPLDGDKPVKIEDIELVDEPAPAAKKLTLNLTAETDEDGEDAPAEKSDAISGRKLKNIIATEIQKAFRANGAGAENRPNHQEVKVNGDAKALDYDRKAKMVADGRAKAIDPHVVPFSAHWKSVLFGTELQMKWDHARGNMWGVQQAMNTIDRILTEQGQKASFTSADLSPLNAQQYIPDLTNLVKEYGVARRVLRVVEMTSDTAKLPRASGALTVGYPASNGAPATQTRSFDTINLTAKHGVILGQIPLDAMEDNLINVADDFAKECSRGFAKVEDDTWINGTGSVASNYMPDTLGIATQFGLITSTDSRSFAGGTDQTSHTDAHLSGFMALLGRFTDLSNLAFYGSPATIDRVLFRLSKAQGGVTQAEYRDLGTVSKVFGFPVIPVHGMNATSVATSGTIDLLFGDMRLAGTLGNRLAMQFDVSADAAFTSSAMVLRARGRHDMVIHNIGSTSTESPVVALHQT